MFIYSYCSLWVHTSTPGADCSVMSSGTQGSQCKKRRETREVRNHWPITDRSARRKGKIKGGERELAFENARESDKERVYSPEHGSFSLQRLYPPIQGKTNQPKLDRSFPNELQAS